MSKLCKFTFKADGELLLEIKNQTEEQIRNLFNNFNKEIDRGFEDSFIDYLKGEGIEFVVCIPDLELEG